MSLAEQITDAVEDSKKAKGAHVWERDDLDWYVEPSFATEALLSVERFFGMVWDPACGQGNIVKALLAAGIAGYGTDVVQRVQPAPGWFNGTRDFLRLPDSVRVDNICTNAPFFRAKGTEAFIRKALTVARGKVVVFTDIKFLAGTGRANGLWAEHPPHRVWIITPRPSCPPGEWLAAGNEASGGTADWVWLVWSNSDPWTGTNVGWLRRPPKELKAEGVLDNG